MDIVILSKSIIGKGVLLIEKVTFMYLSQKIFENEGCTYLIESFWIFQKGLHLIEGYP